MNAKPVLLVSSVAFAISVLVNLPTRAHTDSSTTRPIVSQVTTSDGVPGPRESFRITFFNDGQSPLIEGVTTDPVTGQRYWSGAQDPGKVDPSKSFKENFKEYLDPSDETNIEILGFKRDKPGGGGIRPMNPPWNTHCHKTIIIGGIPTIVHC